MDKMKTFIPMSQLAMGFEEDIDLLIGQLHEAGATRLYFCGFPPAFAPREQLLKSAEEFGRIVTIFENAGFEVSAWIGGTLGHGGPVIDKPKDGYTHIENIDGQVNAGAYCPLDPEFTDAFCDFVRALAKAGAKMIMLDDDYRMEIKEGDPYCFCERHLALMEEYLGRPVDREEFRGVFDGGPSEVREAFRYAQGEGLKRLAAALRRAVDEVNPAVRMGHCAVLTTWDAEGIDSITLARVLAGNTKPFVRLIGAAYWANLRVFGCKYITAVAQYERMQQQWCADSGVDIEVFAEGDVYPRPRYVCPSAHLEMLDMICRASGGFDGHLKYMYDYGSRAMYEQGYLARHNRNAAARAWIEEHFDGKEAVGLRIFEPIERIRYAEHVGDLGTYSVPSGIKFPAYNAIPSRFCGDEVTVIWGDSAWSATEEHLAHGAMLDGSAADILLRRGFDIGAVSVEKAGVSVNTEWFESGINDRTGLFGTRAHRMVLREDAEVLSYLTTDSGEKIPGSYFWRDGEGRGFYVMAHDGRSIGENTKAFDFTGISGNYRKRQLWDVLAKFGCEIPYCTADAPFLYMSAKRDAHSLSLFLANPFEDAVFAPKIVIGDGYVRAEALSGDAVIGDGCVTLSDIPACSFAAVTVYRD